MYDVYGMIYGYCIILGVLCALAVIAKLLGLA